MTENNANNSTLYFIVGGLLVAVIAIGYFAMNKDGNSSTVVIDTVEDTGSSLKLNIDKDDSVSGTIEKK